MHEVPVLWWSLCQGLQKPEGHLWNVCQRTLHQGLHNYFPRQAPLCKLRPISCLQMRQNGRWLTTAADLPTASQLQKISRNRLFYLKLGWTQPRTSHRPCQTPKLRTTQPLIVPHPVPFHEWWQQSTHSPDTFLAAKPKQITDCTTRSS